MLSQESGKTRRNLGGAFRRLTKLTVHARPLVSKNYQVRLRCPCCDAESWITLEARSESVEQILQTVWDFECEVHGVQRELPMEATERDPASGALSQQSASPTPRERHVRASERLPLHVPVLICGRSGAQGALREDTSTILVNAGGALVPMATHVGTGDLVFLVNGISKQEQEVRVAYVEEFEGRFWVGLAFKNASPNFWLRTRRNPRISKAIRVVVRGTNPNPFVQTAYTVDVSKLGARLDTVGFLVQPGATIEVKRSWHGKARFRVVWVGHIGTDEGNQAGLICLEPEAKIWAPELREAEKEDSANRTSPLNPKKK